MPAKFTAFTTELRIARVLEGEFNWRAVKYNSFEVKEITFDEKKFPVLFYSCFVVFFKYTELLE